MTSASTNAAHVTRSVAATLLNFEPHAAWGGQSLLWPYIFCSTLDYWKQTHTMLEILLLMGMCTYVGKSLRAKGRKPLGYQIGVVASYYGGAFMAGVVYGILVVVTGGEIRDASMTAALLGIATGTVASASVVLLAVMVSPNPQLSQQLFEAGGQQAPQGGFAHRETSTNPYAASRYPAG